MKTLLNVLIAVSLCLSSTAYASPETHRAAAEEMLISSGVDKILDPMIQQVMGMMENQFSQMDIPENKKSIVEKYNKKVTEIIVEDLQWERLKDQFIDIYVNVYTEEEIKEVTRFYKSAIGQKLMEKMPALVQESMKITQQSLQTMIPKLQKITQEMEEELQELDK